MEPNHVRYQFQRRIIGRINQKDKLYEDHASEFVLQYALTCATPLSLTTPNEVVTPSNDLAVITGRSKALLRWLQDDPTIKKQGIFYARSLLVEIIAKDMLSEKVKQRAGDAYNVFFAPTSLDTSSDQQKGGDILLARANHDTTHTPLLLIDISQGTIEARNKPRRHGVNKQLAIPVMVLPLADLPIIVDDPPGKSFHERYIFLRKYLTDIVKPAIATGEYKPFIGFSKQSIQYLKEDFLNIVGDQIFQLERKIARNQPNDSLYDIYINKLEEVCRLFGIAYTIFDPNKNHHAR